MSSVTKSFSKDIDQLEDTLYALNKNKISLKINPGTVKSELKAAEKQFEQTQSAADGFNLELIQANYGNIARNLEAVTRAVGQTEEAISQAENQAGGGDTQAAKSIMNTVAASGIGQMFKDVMLNAGTAYGGELGEALAEAQYDSSEAALGVAEAEKDLITSINENTAALRGWRGDYDVSQALTKGRGASLLSENNQPDNPAASTTMPTRTPLSRSGPWASTMCPMTTSPLCCIRASGCRRRWRLEASGVARRSPLPETPSASGRTRMWTGWPARCCKKSSWRKGGPQSGTR